jgi:hypothetical protein
MRRFKMTRTIRPREVRDEIAEWALEVFSGVDEETGNVLYSPYKAYCEDPECEPCQDIEEMYDEFCKELYEELFGECDRLHAEYGCNESGLSITL